MKKYIIMVFLLIISLLALPSTTFVYAETDATDTPTINTLYPDGVLDYHNLTNVNQIAINDEYIAYTLDNTSINIFNKNSRTSTIVNNFDNIYEMKFVSNNQLIVVDYNTNLLNGTIKVITINENDTNVTSLSNINLSNLRLIDIYESENKVLIGLIINSDSENNRFDLYEIDNTTTINTPTLHYSTPSAYYNNATHLVINENNQYVVYKNENNSRILINQHSSAIKSTPLNMLSDVHKLKYYKDNNKEFLLAFNEENLYLLSDTDYTNPVKYFSKVDMKIEDFTDIDLYNNDIIICDSDSKFIKSFSFYYNNQDIKLNENNLLLSSSDSSLGRFNNATNIFIQGNTYYVSDTKNNRIQIIDNTICYQINNLETDSNPQNVLLDSNQNIYFTVKVHNTDNSYILKYNQNKHSYMKVNDYSLYNETNLGLVSSSTIDNKNNIYLIDYTNNNLILLTSGGLQLKRPLTEFVSTEKTQIDYLRNLDMLVIYNNNQIYLMNIETNNIISTISINNCSDITVDFNYIYVLCNNEIKCIKVDEELHTMQVLEKSLKSDTFKEFQCITYDIVNNKIFAFNTFTQSINYFDCNITENTFNFNDFESKEPLPSSTNILAINIINNGIIYDQPYYLGNLYNNIDSCIGIEEYAEFYRVIFNHNNTLKVGFINKNFTTLLEHNSTNSIKVVTTNVNVPVYKYPTILKSNSQAIITSYIPIHTHIKVSYNSFPVTIDGKQFYLYKNNDTIGYIFNADIVLDEDKTISNLNTENATISAIGQENISIYLDDKTTIISTLANKTRIYVENYDKNSAYTKIIYKDENLNTIQGYVKTDYIEMDKLDNNKIVLILIIVISIIVLIIITTTYIIIRKRK